MGELSPEAHAGLVRQAKRELRRRMRALRQALPASAVAARSAALVERVLALPAYRDARSVALFWPMQDKNEVDLRALDAAARAAKKAVYYPFMDPSGDGYLTGFRLTGDPGELAERGRGFAEPSPDAPSAERGQLDLVILPALAAAADGQRLGYGAGFYDATLPDVCPPATALVVVFAFQLVLELPPSDTDVPVQLVVTDDRVIEVGADRV